MQNAFQRYVNLVKNKIAVSPEKKGHFLVALLHADLAFRGHNATPFCDEFFCWHYAGVALTYLFWETFFTKKP